MFEQTKALCQFFLDQGIPGFDLIVYKDGACVLRHMGGAAGAFASVDPVNNISFYYAQHVRSSPIRPLRQWLYNTIRADLLGETVKVPYDIVDENPTLTY